MVGVVERGIRRCAQSALDGPGPGATREEANVGSGRDEVKPPARRDRLRGCRACAGDARHDRRSAWRDGEVPLGGELVVGVGDDAARDAEVVGELARGRQTRAGEETALLDSAAQCLTEGAAHPAPLEVQLEEEVVAATGP